jgi:hypothetical protein
VLVNILNLYIIYIYIYISMQIHKIYVFLTILMCNGTTGSTIHGISMYGYSTSGKFTVLVPVLVRFAGATGTLAS